ncbi:MAG: 3-isopropylmalate dehydratase [Chloroflexi bacterium]|nr:3-isopropylmalate dehydratase [Chloroflexota bacterium]MDL1884104.1 3-isopropylmalate dehydratase [Anaerolineae bacterium CFX8]
MTVHRVWVYGDNVNTDVIFPGKYTYTLKTPEEIAAHALEDLDPAFASGVRPGDVIVAGRNWGSGSSREQAVTTLKYAGVPVIIAASFGGLYFRNCINQGIWPVVCPDLSQWVQTGETIEINRQAEQILAAGRVFAIPSLSPSVQAILEGGGLLPMLQRRFGKVDT